MTRVWLSDQQVAGPQIVADVAKEAVLDLACGAVDDHQPRGVAGLDRRLGDQLRGEVVVEIARFHR